MKNRSLKITYSFLLITFLCLAIAYSIPANVSAKGESTSARKVSEDKSYPASVEDLSGGKYFPKVKEALKNAKSSIYMVMFFVHFDPKDKRSSVNALVEELINAHKRGVKVKIILDQNIDFTAWEERPGKWQREGKNDPLFVHLKQQGIEAYYDNLYVITHSKVIVIDEELVILGSANWSESSLRKNWEVSCLIRSKDLAKQFLEDFSKITIDYEASILDEERNPPVHLSKTFLKNPSLASLMLKMRDQTAFDLYLLLLREFDGNFEGRVDIDYKSLSHSLGLDKKLKYISARSRLNKALSRLDKKYQLISRKNIPSKGSYVLLLDYPDKRPYCLPRERYCSIPDEYRQYGWHKRLSFSEKYCYLINLCKQGTARGRWWSDYIIGLSKEFNISESSILRGMRGLRKLNIIEIEYSVYSLKESVVERGPVRFRLLGLYSPEVLKKEKERLVKLYGKKRFKKAVKYAEIVYKGSDIQVIEDIIRKMEEYGLTQVDKAFRVVSKKSAGNPTKTYKYVIGILQTEAKN